MGAFDDLIPATKTGGAFDDLIPADAPTLPEVVVTPENETLTDRIKQFLFEPEGAKTLREGIQGAVEAIPHMAVDTAKMGYKGLRMAMGGPEERARIMTEDVIPSALAQGQQTAADIQSPFGTSEWLRGATQIGMMAAPGLELFRELRAPVEIPREIPPVQVEPTLAERITQPRVEPPVPPETPPAAAEPPPPGAGAPVEQPSRAGLPTPPVAEPPVPPVQTETMQLSPAERNGQILERRKGILARKAELTARAEGGEQGLEAQLAAVEAELNDPVTNPVVHAPPAREVPVRAPVAETPPEPYTPEAAAARAAQPVVEPVVETAGEPTALKNAITAAEREARGLSPREQVEERSWEQAKAIAEQEAATDSGKGARIVKELNEKPRALDDIEGAHLLRRKVEVQKEHDAAVKAVNENPGNESMVSRLDDATEELQATYDAAETSGTAWGRGGAIRQALMAEDFSLANMKAVARAKINKGEKLSPEQIKNVEALHERLATAEDKVASFEARDAFNEALKQARPQTRTPGGLQGFLDQQAARARERIVARRGRLYADPTGATQVAHLVDEAIIGASHIARGVTKFADWSGAMIREFGENIKPFLKDLYARSKEMANRTTKGKLTPEERETRGLAADIKRIVAGTETYRARTEARDVSPLRPKREPRMNKEKADALFEREEAKKDYKEMLLVEQLKQQTALQKTRRYAAEALRSVRSVKFSFDISGLMQQGAFESFGHPIAQARRLKPMFEALASERGQFRVMQELRDMPEWKNGEFKQAGVEFADIDTANLNKREEIFSSRIAGYVPGVKMSERAFVTLLNQIRAQRYVALRDSLFKGGIFRRGGELTLAEKQILGNFVNVSTGRGNLWKFKQATGFLNAIFSAPRLRVSNFQLLFGQPIWHKLGSGSWRVRQLMLKEYAQTAAGVGLAVYAVSQIPGVEVETDRRSTNYGQIRIGDLRINPFSRLQSIFVLGSRIQTGETKTQGGKIVPNRGKVPYGGDTGLDLSMRYLRSGATPNIAATINSIVGSTVTGEPTTVVKEIAGAPLPLSINGLSDALKAEGVPAQTAAGIASFIGLGVGHFGHKTGKQKDIERRRLEERDQALLSGDFPRAYELSFRYPEEGQ